MFLLKINNDKFKIKTYIIRNILITKTNLYITFKGVARKSCSYFVRINFLTLPYFFIFYTCFMRKIVIEREMDE